MIFQSTPPARGATSRCVILAWCCSYFNPRPPRGGRPRIHFFHVKQLDFNPRPPRGGRRNKIFDKIKNRAQISIHAPREGGDFIDEVSLIWDNHFNPRPPRGGRPFTFFRRLLILIFQSTPPARGATLLMKSVLYGIIISIHAPREGGDEALPVIQPEPIYFNPRPPRGGRLLCFCMSIFQLLFQSTPPARGATAKMHSFICESLTNK